MLVSFYVCVKQLSEILQNTNG